MQLYKKLIANLCISPNAQQSSPGTQKHVLKDSVIIIEADCSKTSPLSLQQLFNCLPHNILEPLHYCHACKGISFSNCSGSLLAFMLLMPYTVAGRAFNIQVSPHHFLPYKLLMNSYCAQIEIQNSSHSLRALESLAFAYCSAVISYHSFPCTLALFLQPSDPRLVLSLIF